MAPFQRIAWIVNPAARGGRSGRGWSGLARELPGSAQALITSAPGDATRFALDAAARGADLVVSIGGDGTLNEVVEGLMALDGPQRPALAMLPCGTGCDFGRSFGLSRSTREFAALLERGRTRSLDIGRARYRCGTSGATLARCFHNVCSFGMSARVVQEASRTTRALGGTVAFLVGALKAIAAPNSAIELSFDDGPFQAADRTLVAVCNGRYFGGGMHIGPGADPSDGLFDVIDVGAMSTPARLANLWRLYSGRHLSMSEVRCVRARRIVARAHGEVPLEMDGEQPGTLPLEIELVPHALQLVC